VADELGYTPDDIRRRAVRAKGVQDLRAEMKKHGVHETEAAARLWDDAGNYVGPTVFDQGKLLFGRQAMTSSGDTRHVFRGHVDVARRFYADYGRRPEKRDVKEGRISIHQYQWSLFCIKYLSGRDVIGWDFQAITDLVDLHRGDLDAIGLGADDVDPRAHASMRRIAASYAKVVAWAGSSDGRPKSRGQRRVKTPAEKQERALQNFLQDQARMLQGKKTGMTVDQQQGRELVRRGLLRLDATFDWSKVRAPGAVLPSTASSAAAPKRKRASAAPARPARPKEWLAADAPGPYAKRPRRCDQRQNRDVSRRPAVDDSDDDDEEPFMWHWPNHTGRVHDDDDLPMWLWPNYTGRSPDE